jgi:hypothetical protein
MTPDQLARLLTESRLSNAAHAWVVLGEELGFVAETVEPVDEKTERHFTAVPVEATV